MQMRTACPAWAGHDTLASPGGRGLVLLVADLLEPIDVLTVERLLQRDVHHAGVRRGAVPVLLARWDPHRVAGADLLHRTAPRLHPAAAHQHVQRLTEGM